MIVIRGSDDHCFAFEHAPKICQSCQRGVPCLTPESRTFLRTNGLWKSVLLFNTKYLIHLKHTLVKYLVFGAIGMHLKDLKELFQTRLGYS